MPLTYKTYSLETWQHYITNYYTHTYIYIYLENICDMSEWPTKLLHFSSKVRPSSPELPPVFLYTILVGRKILLSTRQLVYIVMNNCSFQNLNSFFWIEKTPARKETMLKYLISPCDTFVETRKSLYISPSSVTSVPKQTPLLWEELRPSATSA